MLIIHHIMPHIRIIKDVKHVIFHFSTPQPTVAHPVTAHGMFTMGHDPTSAIGIYPASRTPLANGGGSSCALNTPDHLIPELKANLGAHRPLNRQCV